MALHPYSVNDLNNIDERTQVPYRLAFVTSIIGVGLAYALGKVSQWGGLTIVSAPSTLAIYLFLLKLIEKRLWRNRIARVLFGISTPDLNGKWNGVVLGKKPDGRYFGNVTVKMIIQQNWRTMSLNFETDRTKSESDTAAIISGAGEFKVLYHFDARKKRAFDDFQDQFGSGELRVKTENDQIVPESLESTFFSNIGERGQVRFTQKDDMSSLKEELILEARRKDRQVEIDWHGPISASERIHP